VTSPHFLRLYAGFATAYLLSYFYRSVNAVISPDLSRDLGISASSLGLLTSAYFLAFAAMQPPAGMLLDRYGPRRVEPVLLTIAGCGALAFSASDNLTGLTLGRALIGAGVAVCLMAPLKAIAMWYPPERQASLSGWMMVAGAVGALLATAPLAAALVVLSWRAIFVALAAGTFVAAAILFFTVPDIPRQSGAPGFLPQWRGVRSVLRSPRFWWLAPLAMTCMGSFMAIQGLWSVPWLIEVDGYERSVAARHLLVMGIAILVGYFGLGLFATRLARRGIAARHLFVTGFGISILALTLIVTRAVPFTYLLWALYGCGSSVNVLGFTVLGQGFPRELTARANTTLNLLMFGGSFLAQWGIGLLVDAARIGLGMDTAGGLRLAFALVLVLNVTAFGWLLLGWRRHVIEPALVALAKT
jgi:predicted MFS family arabinose efflux permease